MNPSIEKLEAEAGTTGFRVDMLEKVVRLLRVLEGMRDHPFLKCKLAITGGTALSHFIFDVPRLSVDIDLNYVGSAARVDMMAERPEIERALQAVFGRQDLVSPSVFPRSTPAASGCSAILAPGGELAHSIWMSTTCSGCRCGP